jgi:CRP-like cAMP-binding protein
LQTTILEALQANKNKPLSYFRRMKISKGCVLRCPDEAPSVGIVLSGQMRGSLCHSGQELTVQTVLRGQLFLSGMGVTFRARNHTELLITSRKMFHDLAVSSPEIGSWAFTWMEEQLSRTLRVVEGIHFLSVRDRLIRFIADLCKDQGSKVLDGISAPFDYTIEEVANVIGASRQSTSQNFNALIKEKLIIRVSRSQLIVPDLNRLTLQSEHKEKVPLVLPTFTPFSRGSLMRDYRSDDDNEERRNGTGG